MRKRDRIAAILIVVTLAVALFAVGSVLRWAVLLSAVLATVCAVPFLTSRRHIVSRSPLLLFLVMAFCFTLLQVIPLPAALVKLLSPGAYELVAGNASALGLSTPSFMVLSYAPAATLLELAKFASYVLFGFACLRVAAHRKGRAILCMAVAGSGIAVALTAHAHEIMGLKKLYGIYTPSINFRFLSPLLNENHLAGFLAMTSPLCLGLAVAQRGPRRLIWLVGAIVCIGTALLSGSRGGVLALLLGLGLATILLLVQRRRGTRDTAGPVRMSVLLPAGIVTLCVCILLGALTAGGVAKELAHTAQTDVVNEESKIQLWRQSSTLLRENRWTGVGRGGFEAAFTRVAPSTTNTFSHVENEPLQAALDWGIPMAAALALALILVVMTAIRRWQTGPLEAVALAGLVAIAIQNMVDFNLEFPSVALAAIALLCTLTPPTLSHGKSKSKSNTVKRATYVRLGLFAAAIAVLAVATGARTRTAHADAQLLQSMAAADAAPETHTTTAKRLFLRHPADYVIAGLTAQALFRVPAERNSAFAVARRALARNPRHAGLNQLAARMLLNASPPRTDEALIQYAVALTHVAGPTRLLAELLSLFPAPEVAARGLPLNLDRAKLLSMYLLQGKAAPVAYEYGRRLVASFPKDPRALFLLASAARASGRAGEALVPARESYELRPSTESALLLARVQLANSDSAGAAVSIEQALTIAGGRGARKEIVTLTFMKLTLLVRQSKFSQARITAHGLKRLLVSDRRNLRRLHQQLVLIETKLGNRHQAEWERKRVKQLSAP